MRYMDSASNHTFFLSYVCYTARMLAELEDLTSAIEGNRIVPHFQPIVELRTGILTGFEVLARWQHPLLGPNLPANFIPMAEENGLIDALTHQVFSKALALAPSLPAPLTMSVNISAPQLHSHSLPIEIRRLAEEACFPMDRLIVEITESALLKDLPTAKQIAGKLKEMGCKLALDDFGTGYSSLGHLRGLPFDQLKIDRSFVGEMTKLRDSRKIVAAIVGLAQSLGLDSVGEGVETEEQAHLLLWLGCELAQGWRYGRPVCAAEVPGVIQAAPLPVVQGLATPGEDWATSNLEALPALRLAQLQAIYDGAPVGLCFLDRKLRYVNLNRRLAEMNGLSVKAHLGRTAKELYPGWFPIFEPHLARALQGEAISGVELTRQAAEIGRRDWTFLASFQPAWDESDEVIGVSISLLDITESKQGTGRFNASAGLESSQSETNPEVPWVMDAEGNDLQASSRWVQTTPLGKDRTRNLKWLEALHPEDLELTVKTMKEALRTGKPIDVEYRVLGVDGVWRWMRSTGSPRYKPSGDISRWYGSVEDIHDRKLMETSIGESWQTSMGQRNIESNGIQEASQSQESPVNAACGAPSTPE